MSRRLRRFVIGSSALVLSLALLPAEALAQRGRGRGVRVSRPVVVRTYVYRPYYYPSSFYRPLYWGAGYGWGYGWGSGWYDPFWYQRYPYPPPRYRYDYDEASARLEVTPKDAQVFVDGYYVGSVDDFDGVFQRLHVRSGEHTLEIYKEGYRTIRERVDFRRGETYKVKFAMEPLADGEPKPARPAPDPNAPARDDRPERDERPDRMRGAPGEARGAVRGDGGALAIRVQPGGATVLVDGERWDALDGREPLVIHLAEGTYKIEVQREGYRPYTADIRVRRGETVPLNINLRPDR